MTPRPSHRYRRTPLPYAPTDGVGWTMLCWFAIIFSPFAGFWVHGRVDGRGVETGLKLAVVPLAGLVYLYLRGIRRWRAVPQPVRDEHRRGRLFPPDDEPALADPFVAQEGRERIELRPEGVTMASASLLTFSSVSRAWHDAPMAHQAGQYFVAWDEVAEWQVHENDDGADFHRLVLHDGTSISVARQRALEPELLDAVRAIGRKPVRLFCDVD